MANRKKRIGIPGWVLGESTFGVKKNYLQFIMKFGKPIILAPGSSDVEDIDLLLLPGGADVSPARYKEWPSFWTGAPNQMLEVFDTMMLPKYIEAGVPVVGICRGMQTLYVHFGGKLVQHISQYYHSTSKHDEDEVHLLSFTDKYREFSKDANGKHLILGKVNSRHHQVVDPNNCPEELDIVCNYAYEKDKKIFYQPEWPESIIHKEKKIFGVQWHPEDCENDQLTPSVIRDFLGIK